MRDPRRAFSLVELLVVVVVLSALAALLFPVLARDRTERRLGADAVRLGSVYRALKLYEADDGEMPPYLTRLVPRYAKADALRGVGDTRQPRKGPLDPARTPLERTALAQAVLDAKAPDPDRRDASLRALREAAAEREYEGDTYPAAPGCEPRPHAPCPRSDVMVSDVYLKTFERRLPPGTTFRGLEARPEVGLLAALHHAELSVPTRAEGDGPDAGLFHDSGVFLRTTMDGATETLPIRGWGVTQGCTVEQCFLN